jgi:hypothetical protein
MAILFTAVARIRDWQALQRLNHEALVGLARDTKVTRYRLYRNVRDASQLLLVAELADDEAAAEWSREIGEYLDPLLDEGATDDRVWEATTFDGIG